MSAWRTMLRPLGSVAAGLALAALVMLASGYNPLAAYGAMWSGATGLAGGPAHAASQIPLGSGHLDTFQFAQSLAKVTPLLFCGLAVALGLRAGLFNIGAQGQMTVGALAAAVVGTWGGAHGLPAPAQVPLVLFAGASGGALWGAIPGALKAVRGVHEVISTIMLNFIGINVVSYLVANNVRDPESQNLQTVEIAKSAWLSPLVPHSSLTVGFFAALTAAAAVVFLIRRTALGYEIRAVGLGADAARAAGIAVPRTLVITMALSGLLAGLAGAIEVMGVQHRYVDGIAGTYGFDGIAVALLGGMGGGVVLSALFFGALASGATYMEGLTNVPAPISVIVQAVVIAFVGMRFLKKPDAPIPAAPVPEAEERRVEDAVV